MSSDNELSERPPEPRLPKCVCGHDEEAHDGVCFALDYDKRECPCNEYRPRAAAEPRVRSTDSKMEQDAER